MSGAVTIRELVPHAGSMCLLDAVVAWDARRATLVARSHREAGNPLRRHGKLSAFSLCEYGAQAMAVHGGLVARAAGEAPAAGYLVSLRDVEFAADSIDELLDELLIEVDCLAAGGLGLQYRFRVSCADRELARGRAAVIAPRDARRA